MPTDIPEAQKKEPEPPIYESHLTGADNCILLMCTTAGIAYLHIVPSIGWTDVDQTGDDASSAPNID